MRVFPSASTLLHILTLLTLLLFLSGCAARENTIGDKAAPIEQAEHTEIDFEDYDDVEPEIVDPLEGWNRVWFTFNDFFLLRVVKPVYTGYATITPEPVRNGISNVYHNLLAPVRVLNCVLQGRFAEAWIELGKFLVNSTGGFGGVFDITRGKKTKVPVDSRDADFGQTLATWGVGEGIYLVWPFFGPSTARDTIGLVGDIAASPFFWSTQPIGGLKWEPLLAANVGFRFNDMGSTIATYEAITKSAVEPYIAARDAYIAYRRAIHTYQNQN